MTSTADDLMAFIDTPPDFGQLLIDLQRGTSHTSNGWVPLPAAYVVAPVVAHSSARSMSTMSTAPSTTGGGASVASGVSALTSASAAPIAQTRIQNPGNDAAFNDVALRGALGPLIRANRPPRNDAGNEFCVGWWCKGGCYSSCGRRSAHVPFASPGERERLLAYVAEFCDRSDTRRLRVQQPEHLRPEAILPATQASWHHKWARRGLETTREPTIGTQD